MARPSAARRAPRPSLDVEEVRGAEALAARSDEWSALWERCRTATTFQRPAWLSPWARRFAGDRVRALLLYRGGRLVGLLPTWRRLDEDGRPVLALLGAGITDLLDALVEDGEEDAALAAFGAHLLASREAFDRVELDGLAPGAVLLRAAPPGFVALDEEQEVCPVLDLGRPDVPPRRLRANLRTARRRAARLGSCAVHFSDPESVERTMGDLFALHGARWRSRGGAGAFAHPEVRAFHLEAARGLAAAGALRLLALSLDGVPVAACCGAVDKGRALYLFGGFDPAYAAISPGSLALAAFLDDARARGARELDLLRGAEAYKYAWGARDRVLRRRVLRPARR